MTLNAIMYMFIVHLQSAHFKNIRSITAFVSHYFNRILT